MRAVLITVAIWAFACAFAGVGAHATYGARTTADEPQYLLTAISLAEDGDVDIADELAEERWRTFHEAPLPEQTRPLPGGQRVSPHDPLLPLLLVPGVALAGWAGAKVTLALVAAALAALLTWTAVERLAVPLRTAALVVGVFAGSLPLAPYGSQIYPELPAALVVTGAVAQLLAPRVRAVAIGVLTVALPWLALKYAPVAAVLAVAAGVRLWREGRRSAVFGLAIGLGVAGAVYLGVHQLIWTGFTPYASGDHFVDRGELSVVGFAPNYWGRSQRLIGLLVDARFGLGARQPAWLLAVPAVTALVIRRPPAWVVLTASLTAGWLTATFVALTMQGFWVPGRQVVVIAPLAVLAIAWWAGQAALHLRLVLGIGLVGVAAHLWLAVEATTGRLTWVVDPWLTAYPPYRLWRLALPDYLVTTDAKRWIAHGVWVGLVIGLILWSKVRTTVVGGSS